MASGKVLSPSKMAHIVLRTNNFAKMRDFYATFLGGRVIYDNGFLAFVSYDDEHYRIVVALSPSAKNKEQDICGLEHFAFTFDSLKDLCAAYKQRKAVGIEPGWCVNHGLTTSIYYLDPDGNMIESQVDNFDNVEEATAFMTGPLFRTNPFGVDFEPEELCKQVESGIDDKTLKEIKDIGPRGVEDLPRIMEKMNKATTGA